jgi:hypothetical protein
LLPRQGFCQVHARYARADLGFDRFELDTHSPSFLVPCVTLATGVPSSFMHRR